MSRISVMKTLFKTLFLSVVLLQVKCLLGVGDRVEMRIYSNMDLASESIIDVLNQGDVVTLDFCPSENIMDTFRIHIVPIFPLSTENIVHIEVDTEFYEKSDFYVRKLLELINLLHKNCYKIYLQNLTTYIFVDGNILQLGQRDTYDEQKNLNDGQMIRLAIAIKNYTKISTLMLNECPMQIGFAFAVELLSAMGWKISEFSSSPHLIATDL